ncbi:MAG: hypothetical protein ACKO85_19655 [Isosphaeraceae bacterium]
MSSCQTDQLLNQFKWPNGPVGQPVPAVQEWFDLPVYEPVWEHVNNWLSGCKTPAGTWRITAGEGCGKTLLCNEIRTRNRHRRLKLIHAEFKAGETISHALLLHAWSKKIQPHVELPEWVTAGDKLMEWLDLAIECLSLQGYFVRLAVEADRLDRQAADLARQQQALFLCREPFRGLSGSESPILPPWSEGDIAEVLCQMVFESATPKPGPGHLWSLTRGCPRDVISLLVSGEGLIHSRLIH